MPIKLIDTRDKKYPQCNFCLCRENIKEIKHPQSTLVVSICGNCLETIYKDHLIIKLKK